MAAVTGALLAATVLGGLNQAAQARNQGRIARAEGEAEGELFGLNAGYADSQAADAIARGQHAEARQRLSNKELLGAQRAAYAGQGVDVSAAGTSVTDVTQGDQAVGEIDALTLRNNAMREAWGYRAQAAVYRYQGEQARLAGRTRQSQYNDEALSTLLTTGGEVLDQYSQNRSTRSSAPRIGGGSHSIYGGSPPGGGSRNGTMSR